MITNERVSIKNTYREYINKIKTDYYNRYFENLDDEFLMEIIENQREILTQVSSTYGFYELSEDHVFESEGKEIHQRSIRKGVYRHNSQHTALWFKGAPDQYLPEYIGKIFKNSREVEKTYLGEKYFLALVNKRVHGFDITYYNHIVNLIHELDHSIDVTIKRILINEDKKTLLIETPCVFFAIAGLNIDNIEEEERIIMSERLKKSQPFFEFKAPIDIDWNKLKQNKDEYFERLCEHLLLKESNIISVIPIGKTRAPDRGRDFEVHEKTTGFIDKKFTKWLVQCKYSKNSVPPSVITGWTDRVIEHGYDGFWLMTNNDLTPSLFDQFKDVERNKKKDIKVRFWQRTDFYIKLNIYSEILSDELFFKS